MRLAQIAADIENLVEGKVPAGTRRVRKVDGELKVYIKQSDGSWKVFKGAKTNRHSATLARPHRY